MNFHCLCWATLWGNGWSCSGGESRYYSQQSSTAAQKSEHLYHLQSDSPGPSPVIAEKHRRVSGTCTRAIVNQVVLTASITCNVGSARPTPSSGSVSVSQSGIPPHSHVGLNRRLIVSKPQYFWRPQEAACLFVFVYMCEVPSMCVCLCPGRGWSRAYRALTAGSRSV